MFPVMLDLTGRLAVVVGGGTVGRRKVAALRAAGARVRVVCLEARSADQADVEWLCESYQASHLDGAAIVFAAAPAEVNREVVRDARSRGIWATDAAEPTAGDFHTPAVLRRGGLVVAVGTSGASPLLAARIRDRIDAALEPEYAAWVTLLAELRPEVLAVDPGRRRAVFERLCDDVWLERLWSLGIDAVRSAMRDEIVG
jgi:precorrin-2 dehydrogenase / sirohydrochlorin ferrochelatase